MKRRLLHTLAVAVVVLAWAYVSVVLTVGTTWTLDWSRRGQTPRAFWVGLATAGLMIPGIVIAGITAWYLQSQRRRGAGDVRKGGFDVLPPP